MSNRTVVYEREEDVAVVQINALLEDEAGLRCLVNDLSDVMNEIRMDNDIRVALITGSLQDAFYSAKNLGVYGLSEKTEGWPKFLSLADKIADFDRPVVAGITDDAIGLGLELALACDIRISGELSHFGLPHIKTGLIPCDGGTQRLSRLVGRGKAMEMILTGEIIDANEALRIGLVNRIVGAREIGAVVKDMALDMACKAPISLRYAKEAVCRGMEHTLEQGLRLEADLYFLLHTAFDRDEGIKAFQEGRKGEFEGR